MAYKSFIQLVDLQAFRPDINTTQAMAMIDDATALAVAHAPGILAAGFTGDAAVKAILRRAILRWDDAGSGAVTQESMGPFSRTVDTSQPQRGVFLKSEVDQLRGLTTSATVVSLDLSGPA